MNEVAEPVAYFYASIAGPVVLHRLKQMGVAKPLFNQRQVDDDLKAAEDWPKAHSMIPLYTKPQWRGLTLEDIDDIGVSKDWVYGARWAEAKLKEKNTC